ncbi:MAG: hypothetical protein KIG91_08250, partial [Treponema sp.]|nr:hypothetical protein [Treponema sp.]
MKKRHLLASAASLIFATTLISGCSGLFKSASPINGEISDTNVDYEKFAILKGEIENYNEVMAKKAGINASVTNARLILPELEASKYKFILFGERGNVFCGPYELNPADFIGAKGSFTYSMPQGAWNLTLAALESGTDTPSAADCKAGLGNTAILMAKSYVDLSQTDNTANFILSPEGLSKNGYANFDIILEGWTIPESVKNNLKVTAEIRDLLTNTPISETEVKELETGLTANAKANYTTSADGIAPNTYNFVVTFLDDKNTTEDKTDDVEWVYSDRIMIFPGMTTDKDVYISRLIQEKPKAPAAFVASYIKDTYGNPVMNLDMTEYKVRFDWSGKYKKTEGVYEDISNETHFEIQYAEVSNVAGKLMDTFACNSTAHVSDTNPIQWTDDGVEYIIRGENATATSISQTPEDSEKKTAEIKTWSTEILSDPKWVSGSLYSNNTTLTVWLPLGKEYIARIAAVNKTGASDWCYLSLENIQDVVTIDSLANEFEGPTINKFYIKYNLQGGDTTPAKYAAQGGYKLEFGPVKYPTGTEAKIGRQYWNAYVDPDEIKLGGVTPLTGWKKDSPSGQEHELVKPKSTITYSDSEIEQDYSDKGYKNKIEQKITIVRASGRKRETTKAYYSKKDNPTEPTKDTPTELTKDNINPGADWTVPKGVQATTTMDVETLDIYEDCNNLELWAFYGTEADWEFVTNKSLKKEWIKYTLGSYAAQTFTATTNGTPTTATGFGEETNSLTASITLAPGDSHIEWQITNPEEWKFRYYRVTVKPTNSSTA